MKTTKDAARGVKFEITARDIDRAKAKDPRRCAAALALKRQFGADSVEVHSSRTYIEVAGKRKRFATPPALRTEIITLDRGGKFEPGDYVLKPVPASQKKEATARRNRSRAPTKNPIPRRKTPNIRGRAPRR